MKKKSIFHIVILCVCVVVISCILEVMTPEQPLVINNSNEDENYGPNLMVNSGFEECFFFSISILDSRWLVGS